MVFWFQTAFSPAMFVKRMQRLRIALDSDSSSIMTYGSVVRGPSALVSLGELVKNGLHLNQMSWHLKGQGVGYAF